MAVKPQQHKALAVLPPAAVRQVLFLVQAVMVEISLQPLQIFSQLEVVGYVAVMAAPLMLALPHKITVLGVAGSDSLVEIPLQMQ